ncbi:unnamed protein product [Soboliphyme baturini]|uniref:Dynein light chain n=1 Tax=Soboliphyme baturini TaxID=241478 RepID=A0A183IHW6_9BILA|nr:unnamed protein product [Soboliphyme baturini]
MDKSKMRPQIQESDMDLAHQNRAITLTMEAMKRYRSPKKIAGYIKQGFEKKYQGSWNCVVGRQFGVWFEPQVRGFVYFYVGKYAILLWC